MERLAKLQQLHQADPADPFLTYGIALEHAKAAQHDQALHWLDRTLQIDEKYCYAYYQKARVLLQLDQNDQARQVLTQGLGKAQAAGDQHAASEIRELLASLE